MHLQSGTLLQGGKYKIEKVLGQGGFGITYLATQEFFDRHVCIKEFFFKDYCERGSQGEVTSCTTSNKDLVDRFLNKFIKEARTISRLEHPNIVRILDIFQENGTAYYAMEYIEGCSLADKVNEEGALSEAAAVDYIKQVADALDCIHQRSINHLDVKPANIMVRRSDNKVILIDFGLSKQYDEQGGQTSTTPVGISHGYAPMEQYNQGGVSTFSPQTDIYALGATLYKLVTGSTPPQAIEVFNEGLTGIPQSLSPNLVAAIEKTMQPRRNDRPQSISEFRALLGGEYAASVNTSTAQNSDAQNSDDESTRVIGAASSEPVKETSSPQPSVAKVEVKEESSSKKWLWLLVACIVACIVAVLTVVSKEDAMRLEPTGIILEPTGIIYGHEYVDLGLSVKWATCNVGASSPSDYGNYYAWGETITKSNYSSSVTYGLSISELESRGIIGSDGKLTSAYDAASVNWGGTWRMPTLDEFKELKEKCSWVWTSVKRIDGYKVTGPNGNSIFLPAAGYRNYTSLDDAGSYGCYWSATPYSNSYEAYSLYFFDAYDYYLGSYGRSYGRAVRPVSER